MKAHVAAIQTIVEGLGYSFAYGDATGLRYPYVLVWGSPGGPDLEEPLTGVGAWSELLGVTYVDTDSLNVLVMAGRVRPALDRAVLAVTGRDARLRLQAGLGQSVRPDRSVTIPSTNTHPAYAVDRYLLTSQPLSA